MHLFIFYIFSFLAVNLFLSFESICRFFWAASLAPGAFNSCNCPKKADEDFNAELTFSFLSYFPPK